ncbi:hypothetical protein RKD32_001278 [Streptomyces sp. SAI-195]
MTGRHHPCDRLTHHHSHHPSPERQHSEEYRP